MATAASRSMIPRAAPSSQWGLTSSSGRQGSPQVRIRRLSSSPPGVTDSWGMFGIRRYRASTSASASAATALSDLIRAETSFISAMASAASRPALRASAMALFALLASAWSISTSLSVSRRLASAS